MSNGYEDLSDEFWLLDDGVDPPVDYAAELALTDEETEIHYSMYHRYIRQNRDVISREREVELVPIIQAGRRAEARREALTDDVSDELASVIAGGRAARNELFLGHLGLVHQIARHYYQGPDNINDLVQSGYEGLFRAIKTYEVREYSSFSTYAVHWIKFCITRYIDENKFSISLPTQIASQLWKYSEVAGDLFSSLHREPTREEIIQRLKEKKELPVKLVSANSMSSAAAVGTGVSFEALAETNDEDFHARNDSMSDQPRSSYDEPDPAPTELYLMEEVLLQAAVINIVEKWLVPRQLSVMKQYCGLGCEPRTFQEIGDGLGFTWQRAQQIYKRALKSLSEQGVLPELREILYHDG